MAAADAHGDWHTHEIGRHGTALKATLLSGLSGATGSLDMIPRSLGGFDVLEDATACDKRTCGWRLGIAGLGSAGLGSAGLGSAGLGSDGLGSATEDEIGAVVVRNGGTDSKAGQCHGGGEEVGETHAELKRDVRPARWDCAS